MCICVYIYIYIDIYIYVCVCVYIYIYLCVCDFLASQVKLLGYGSSTLSYPLRVQLGYDLVDTSMSTMRTVLIMKTAGDH